MNLLMMEVSLLKGSINLETRDIKNHLRSSMQRYAAEVDLDRSIPDARDGLKPVQRRVLWSFYQNKLFPNAKYRKSATVVGDTMGNYHPHGDASIYDALIRMAHSWDTAVPLIDVHGNMGLPTGEGPAAMRYTEARLAEGGGLMTSNLNKRNVEMTKNFDETKEEPVALPSRIPYVLIGSTSGMGYGLATSIISHNPIELLKASQKLVKQDLTTDQFMEYVKSPDFATGGLVELDTNAIRQEIENGYAQFYVRGKAILDYDHHKIVFREIPANSGWADIAQSIKNLCINYEGNKKFNLLMGKHYKDFIDRTASKSTKVPFWQVDAELIFDKKTSNEDLQMFYQAICDTTTFDTTITANNTVVMDRHIKTAGSKEILKYWINHRLGVLTKELQYDRSEYEKKLVRLNSQIWMIESPDEILKLAHESKNRNELADQILKVLKKNHKDATVEHADYIAGMAIYRIGKGNLDQLEPQRDEVVTNITQIDHDIEHIDDYFIEDVQKTIDFMQSNDDIHSDRRTEIKENFESFDTSELKDVKNIIPEETTYVVVRKDGEISRSSVRKYNNNIEHARSLDDGNYLAFDGECKTNQWLHILTDNGGMVTRLINDLPDGVRPDEPSPMDVHKDIADFSANDNFVKAFVGEDPNQYVLAISNFGRAKVTRICNLMPNTNTRRYYTSISWFFGLKKYMEGEKIAICDLISEDDYKNKTLKLTTDNNEYELPLTSIPLQNGGSGAMRFKKFDSGSIEIN